ncbi:MAG: molybdenum cofactor biosynthesis protein MoaE [Candidatus Njordarchaeia archaeon]
MKPVKIVGKNEITVGELIEILKRNPKADKCGAIVFFIGIVKGQSKDGKKLKKLEYDSDIEKAEEVMENIRTNILEKYPQVKEILIYHVIDELNVGDETIFIGALGEHRRETFEAAREALDRVKQEAPIWKKEVTVEGEHWLLGEEIVKKE